MAPPLVGLYTTDNNTMIDAVMSGVSMYQHYVDQPQTLQYTWLLRNAQDRIVGLSGHLSHGFMTPNFESMPY